jgi:hypothetical protein
VVPNIFSSPARPPQFLPTTSTCSRATELKMLCILRALHAHNSQSDFLDNANQFILFDL